MARTSIPGRHGWSPRARWPIAKSRQVTRHQFRHLDADRGADHAPRGRQQGSRFLGLRLDHRMEVEAFQMPHLMAGDDHLPIRFHAPFQRPAFA
jgi:hypothetical protein